MRAEIASLTIQQFWRESLGRISTPQLKPKVRRS